MDNTLIQAIQEWHTVERQNMVAYDALAASADNVNWPGLCHWCQEAANEEREHAGKVASFLVDKNILPEMQALEAGKAPSDVEQHVYYFRAALDREILTMETIQEIYRMAHDANEYDACEFMNWFLAEQRRSIHEIADYIKMLAAPVDRLVFDNQLK
jgi:ferritin